ncbi:unnamed protein product [Diatraea saccharalis]|uniref:Uncharacterized protein n=1 Tax=Diatraea saccharalis TaxID=40085 RepID=A0A9N9R315_9NEOP|nr:unnamed protein product [Diatraea saccharalis]
MKCNEFEKSKPRHHMNIQNLDKALHDLGMLSAITEARRDYLRESKASPMRYSSRYVSNVTVGYCMRRMTNKNRLCPYVLPVRHRTKSENSDAVISDVNDGGCDFNGVVEPSTSGLGTHDCAKITTKRCQSLENLNLLVDPQPASEVSPDMDCMSTRIQKLQVDE